MPETAAGAAVDTADVIEDFRKRASRCCLLESPEPVERSAASEEEEEEEEEEEDDDGAAFDRPLLFFLSRELPVPFREDAVDTGFFAC